MWPFTRKEQFVKIPDYTYSIHSETEHFVLIELQGQGDFLMYAELLLRDGYQWLDLDRNWNYVLCSKIEKEPQDV